MRINQNISAMNTYSRLTAANTAKSNSLAKLSSGLRINKAGDDAAGLAISEKMRGQVGGLKQAVRNAQDGISLIQTAEGALNETHSILNRMRELAVQAANGTNTESDRDEIQKEMNQLSTEITRISTDTEFNTQKLLNGDLSSNPTKFHIGANSGQNMELDIEDLGAEALKVDGSAKEAVAAEGSIQGINITAADGKNYKLSIVQADAVEDPDNAGSYIAVTNGAKLNEAGDTVVVTLGVAKDGTATEYTLTDIANDISGIAGKNFTAAVDADANGSDSAVAGTGILENGRVAIADIGGAGINVSTAEAADAAISIIDEAVQQVSSERSKLGSIQNRLDHTINNLTATAENLAAAESRIRDVDMAEEMMEFTKNNILSQAATSMLAQANQMPQSVLQLLQ